MPQSPLNAFVAQLRSKAFTAILAGIQKDLLTSDMHGRKYDQAYNNNNWLAANPSGVTTSAGLATTYVGLCLSNPAGSGVNLALRKLSGAFIVLPATNPVGLNLITGFAAGGVTVHTTPLTPFSSKIGAGGTPKGLVDSACTLVGTPIFSRVLGETPTATTAPFFMEEFDEGLILIPGAYAAIGTTIAGPASGFQGSFEWSEYAP
jgi:hypothetical protein